MNNWTSNYLTAINWNSHQLTIFQEALTNNIQVNANAGVGKTTQIIGLCGALGGKKIQILAFNKHIAEQLKEDTRIKGLNNVRINTIHSLCYGLLKRVLGDIDIQDRTSEFVNSFLKDESLNQELYSYIYTKERIDPSSNITKQERKDINVHINIFKQATKQIDNYLRINRLTITYENIYFVIYKYGLKLEYINPYIKFICKCIRYISQLRRTQANNKILDFTQLLELSIDLNLEPTHTDYLIVDEAQDSSLLMLEIYKKFTNNGSQIILLGDYNQSIFAFAGAEPSIWKIMKESFNTIQLPLSYCYRCPDSHIELVKELVKIEMLPANPKQGSVVKGFNKEFIVNKVKSKDLIVSRYNYPLVEYGLELLSKGKKIYIRCTDLSISISRFFRLALEYNKLQDYKTYSLNEYKNLLSGFYKYNHDCIKQNNTSSKELFTISLDTLIDYFNCCNSLIEYIYLYIKENIDVSYIEKYVEELCKPSKNAIILSSIHRAKGAEAKNVWYIVPSADILFRPTNKYNDHIQELNLIYVALTRATQNLYIDSYKELESICEGLLSLISIYEHIDEFINNQDIDIEDFTNINNSINISKVDFIKIITSNHEANNRNFIIEIAVMSQLLYCILEINNPEIIRVLNSFNIKIVINEITNTIHKPGSILLIPLCDELYGVNLSLSSCFYPEDLLSLCL
jgi:superfamily I DNA/RNA helicase